MRTKLCLTISLANSWTDFGTSYLTQLTRLRECQQAVPSSVPRHFKTKYLITQPNNLTTYTKVCLKSLKFSLISLISRKMFSSARCSLQLQNFAIFCHTGSDRQSCFILIGIWLELSELSFSYENKLRDIRALFRQLSIKSTNHQLVGGSTDPGFSVVEDFC